MQRFRGQRVLFQAFFALMLGLVVLAPVAAAQEQEGEMSAPEVVEQVGDAVVTVINEQTVSSAFGQEQTQQVGAGTGFIIDNEGHIVTNWHVVTGGTSYVVILADGTEVNAELIGEDPRDDLAVVKIDPDVVPASVDFGDSNALRPGEAVLAIGSPLGAFGNTVTHGIISALDRDQFGSEGICTSYTNLIQHDAAINQGNSGGPLFNLSGEVIGVNTLGIPSTGPGGIPVQGLFFAVPSETVVAVVDQLINQGFITAPYLGITFITLNPQLAAINNLEYDRGLLVQSVEPGGPASQAGIQPNDIILSLNGNEIRPDNTLSTMLLEYEPGDTVELTVDRGGELITLPLTFGEAPEELFEQCTLRGQP